MESQKRRECIGQKKYLRNNGQEFLKLIKDSNWQIQEAQRKWSRIKANTQIHKIFKSKFNIFKLPETKGNEEIFQEARETKDKLPTEEQI